MREIVSTTGSQLVRLLPLWVISALSFALFATISCTSSDSTSDESSDNGGGTVTIGSLMPSTGDLGVYGPPANTSFKIAFDLVNEAGGVNGKQIRTVERDTATSEQVAVDAANALIHVDGAVAILGAMSSGVTLAVAQSATIPEGVVLMTPASKSPAISTLDDNDFVFRTSTSDELQGGIEADVATALGYSKVATTYINNAYGEGLTRVFSREFEANGGTVTQQVAHESGQASYIAELRRAQESGAEALLVIAYPESAALMLRESAEGGYFEKYMFVDAVRSDSVFEAAGWDAFEGSYGTAPSAPDSPHAATFREMYRQETGEPLDDPFAPFAFDAAAIIALAIEHADSEDPTDIRDSLRQVANPPGKEVGPADLADALEMIRNGEAVNYTGAAGEHDFDERGDVLNSIEIWHVVNGAIEDTGIFLLPGDPIPTLPSAN